MTIHHLKVWPHFYDGLVDGSKTYEVRRNDRGFAVDDILVLHDWNQDTSTYTERPILYTKVLGILEDAPGLIEGYVILTLSMVVQR
jgi:hypothetical protein